MEILVPGLPLCLLDKLRSHFPTLGTEQRSVLARVRTVIADICPGKTAVGYRLGQQMRKREENAS